MQKPSQGGATVVRSRAGTCDQYVFLCICVHMPYTYTFVFVYTHMQKPSQGGATVVRSRAGDTNVILVNQRLGHGWYHHLYDPAPDVAGVAGCIECAGDGLGPGPSSTASGPSSKAVGVTLVCAEGGLSSGPSRTASGPSRNAGVGGAGDAGTGRRLGVAEGRAHSSLLL